MKKILCCAYNSSSNNFKQHLYALLWSSKEFDRETVC